MADLVLPDGQEITFDLRALTTKEYLGFFDVRRKDSSDDKVLAKVCHIDHKDFVALPFEDYKRILNAFFKKCNDPIPDNPNPITDPNSPSASISA